MRAVLIALCVVLFAGTVHAQAKESDTTPIGGCPEVANQYTNYGFFLRIYLLIRADCTYEIHARGNSGVGIAELRLSDGTLILPFQYSKGATDERFELRRNWHNLNGHVMIGGSAHEVSFYPKQWR